LLSPSKDLKEGLNMMLFHGKKICFIGAHPDDIELGCGAFISNISGKTEILCVTLSDNQKNPVLSNLVEEHQHSMAILGVPGDHVRLESFVTRRFPELRQEILEYLYRLNHDYQPDIVFTHTRADIHQDHQQTTEEVLRAFRGTTVLGFDALRSSYGFFPHFLVEVSAADVERKIQALSAYSTYNDKYYFSEAVLRATLIRHGALAERQFAEGFDILRIVGNFGIG
jgi:LmbE family N-acetylglucosaminyl deacetylase